MQMLSTMCNRRSIPFVLIVLFLLLGVNTQQPTVVTAQPKSVSGFESGFNDQFTTPNSNWAASSGSWAFKNGYGHGVGTKKQAWSQVAFVRASYANLDFQARMRRTGCGTCGNGVFVRNTTSGVRFKYANTGEYIIEKCNPVSCVAISSWTLSSAVLRGGFNTLRVVAIGNTYDFFINNKLVATKVITGIGSGQVGVSFYSNQTEGNALDVDWAVLNRR